MKLLDCAYYEWFYPTATHENLLVIWGWDGIDRVEDIERVPGIEFVAQKQGASFLRFPDEHKDMVVGLLEGYEDRT